MAIFYGLLIADIIIAYLLGSINSSIILSKFVFKADDIRNSGSGNAGATNMLRTYGKKAGIFTLIGDMLKGIIAVFVGVGFQLFIQKYTNPAEIYSGMGMGAVAGAESVSVFLFGQPVGNVKLLIYIVPLFKYIAGFFVMLGHIFPVFFRFKGGKGVATAAAVVLSLDMKTGIVVIVLAVIVMAVSRYVSFGSVIGAASYPLIIIGTVINEFEYDKLAHMIFAILIAAICILKHSENIKRLKNGEENKLSFKSKKSDK